MGRLCVFLSLDLHLTEAWLGTCPCLGFVQEVNLPLRRSTPSNLLRDRWGPPAWTAGGLAGCPGSHAVSAVCSPVSSPPEQAHTYALLFSIVVEYISACAKVWRFLSSGCVAADSAWSWETPGSSPASGRVCCPGVSGVHSCALSLSSRGAHDRVRIWLHLTVALFSFPAETRMGTLMTSPSLSRYSDNWEAAGARGPPSTISSTCASLCPRRLAREWGARRLVGSVREFGRGRGVRTDSLKSHHSDMGVGTH